MVYKNPVIRGFYPDPSICKAKGKYFLAASSFHFFPGVPLFESDDLVNWRQIGFCLTRESQLSLENTGSSGGIYAPTIRCDKDRFYLVTTNVGCKQKGGNFYVWTDDIYGEWSEPVFVDQGGIDPSLYFENDKAYFMSNGQDYNGENAIIQCEIDLTTGKKITDSKVLWYGTGGRYLEAPHMYKIGNYYYLMAAEGGTEYGHMVVYARGDNVWGPFTPYLKNPVLTNRNLGGYQLQGIGHGDLVEDADGNWWMFALAFRQIHEWMTFHHLGRETCLIPVTFDKDGWFTAGDGAGSTPEKFIGTAKLSFDTDRINSDVEQTMKTSYTFSNTDWKKDWQFLRTFKKENYIFGKDFVHIKSSGCTLDTPGGSPAFICLHQNDFDMELSVNVKLLNGEAGVSVYMDENHHYDIALVYCAETRVHKVILRLNIGDIKHEKAAAVIAHNETKLLIRSNAINYDFYYIDDQQEIKLGSAQTKYLSSEVAGGFTGVVLGLFSQGGDGFNEFSCFDVGYS